MARLGGFADLARRAGVTGGETVLREACELYEELVWAAGGKLLGGWDGALPNLAVARWEADRLKGCPDSRRAAVKIMTEVAG